LNTRTAIIAVTIALILAAIAAVSLRAPRPAAALAMPAWLGDLDPSALSAVTISSPAARTIVLEPIEPAGTWWLVQPDSPLRDAPWPVRIENLRAALGGVADLRTLTPERAHGGDAWTRVEFRWRDGRVEAVEFAPDALGGKTLARVRDAAGPMVAIAPASTGAVFAAEGVLSWRDRSLLGPDAGAAWRLELDGPAGRLALQRVGTRWALVEPIAAPADDAACAAAVAALSGLEASRLLPVDADIGADLDAPAVPTFTTRTLVRAPDDRGEVRERTLRRTVRIGGFADPARASVFVAAARSWENDEGPTAAITAVVPAAAIAAVNADPAAYVSRVALRVPEADITAITLTPESGAPTIFTRTLDGWTRDGARAAPVDDRALAALRTLLTTTRATTVLLTEPEAATYGPTITISAGPGEAGTLRLGLAAGKPILATPQVWRRYEDPPTAEVARWLLSLNSD